MCYKNPNFMGDQFHSFYLILTHPQSIFLFFISLDVPFFSSSCRLKTKGTVVVEGTHWEWRKKKTNINYRWNCSSFWCCFVWICMCVCVEMVNEEWHYINSLLILQNDIRLHFSVYYDLSLPYTLFRWIEFMCAHTTKRKGKKFTA